MKLWDVMLCMPTGIELTIWDQDVFTEFYMYPESEVNEKDSWEKSMELIAKSLEVIKGTHEGITCNVRDVIAKAKAFGFLDGICKKSAEAEDIVEDMNAIMAGNVSEEWMAKFAEALYSASMVPMEEICMSS